MRRQGTIQKIEKSYRIVWIFVALYSFNLTAVYGKTVVRWFFSHEVAASAVCSDRLCVYNEAS